MLANDFAHIHYDNVRKPDSVIELVSRYSMSEHLKVIWKLEFLKELRNRCFMPLILSLPEGSYVYSVETALVFDMDAEVVVEIRAIIKKRPTEN